MAAWKSVCLQVCAVSGKEHAMELCQKLQEEEDKLGYELEKLLEQQTQIDVQMTNFRRIIPALQNLQIDSQGLNGAITKTSCLAENISDKVRTLDTAKTNVYASLKRVEDILDLKNCVDGVQQAMTSGNFEQAALHIRRYLDLDEKQLLESAVDIINIGTNTVSASFSKLKDAEIKLKEIVKQKLTNAVYDKDRKEVDRFVKIMPLLNLHQDGIDLLTQLLNSEIENFSQNKLKTAADTTGDQGGLVYSQVLMNIYEDIARIYEQYMTLIESTYGATWIIPFLEKIQSECDKQVKAILNQHSEERHLENKVHTIAIALNSRTTAGAIRPEPRELDTLLAEMSLISSRTELYFKFLKRKAKLFNIESEVYNVIKNSQTSRVIQEMIGKYILIENFFMRESLSKAVDVDDNGVNDMVSSLCDDAFFVLQKSLKRGFSTHNADGACAMINNASTLLLKEYREQLQKNLTSQPTPTQSGGGIDLSDFPSMFQTQTSKSSTPGPSAWKGIGVACNNIETSCQNLKKLINLLQNEIKVLLNDSGDIEKAKLDSCLSELQSTLTALQALKQEAQLYIIEVLISPELAPLVNLFSASSHVIEDDAVLLNDDFIQRLAAFISQKLSEAKANLLSELFEDLVLHLVSEIGNALEFQIMSSVFNQLGGVQLDRDLRQIVSFLSNQTQHPVRDKFARILQMATILSFENVGELHEYYNISSGPSLLHLNLREIKEVMCLRKDFRRDEIDNLNINF